MAINFSTHSPAQPPGPTAGTPDEAELVHNQENRDASDVLRLAVAQMHCALEEGHPPVQTLSNAITLMHEALGNLRAQYQHIENPGILASHDLMAKQLGSAVLAIQFYDRLVQRLGHVRQSMELLEDILGGEDHSPEHWHQVLEMIQATYTMEDEKRVFAVVMNGGSAQDIAPIPPPADPSGGDDGSIELF